MTHQRTVKLHADCLEQVLLCLQHRPVGQRSRILLAQIQEQVLRFGTLQE